MSKKNRPYGPSGLVGLGIVLIAFVFVLALVLAGALHLLGYSTGAVRLATGMFLVVSVPTVILTLYQEWKKEGGS